MEIERSSDLESQKRSIEEVAKGQKTVVNESSVVKGLKCRADHLIEMWNEDPISTRYALKLSVLMAETGNYQDSKKIIDRLGEMHLGISYANNPELRAKISSYHRELGCLYASCERTDSAAIHFQESLKLTPSSEESCQAYGQMLYQHGRYQECIGLMKAWIDQHPHHYECLMILGSAYLGASEYNEAKHTFLEVLAEAEGGLAKRASIMLATADHLVSKRMTGSTVASSSESSHE